MDPIVWRGIERLVISVGSIIIAYLGYRLYLHGVKSGKNTVEVESPLLKFALSGTGPGLFFMAFGACVLSISLYTGGAKSNTKEEFGGLISLETNAELQSNENDGQSYCILSEEFDQYIHNIAEASFDAGRRIDDIDRRLLFLEEKEKLNR